MLIQRLNQEVNKLVEQIDEKYLDFSLNKAETEQISRQIDKMNRESRDIQEENDERLDLIEK